MTEQAINVIGTFQKVCIRGHDLTVPGARYADGRGCRACKRERYYAIKEGREVEKRGWRKAVCKRGHNTSVPGSRDPRTNQCILCVRARRAAERQRQAVRSAKNAETRVVRRRRDDSRACLASAIDRRMLEIADALDIAPKWEADELRAEMRVLVRRKDDILRGADA